MTFFRGRSALEPIMAFIHSRCRALRDSILPFHSFYGFKFSKTYLDYTRIACHVYVYFYNITHCDKP